MDQNNPFSKIIRGSVYLLTFLFPFFFLPWPYEKVEFAKQILLWTLAGTAFLAWVARMILYDKEIKFKKDWFSIAVAVFVVINFLIFIASKDKYASLWGRFGRYSDSLIGLFSLSLLFYTIVNNWELFSQSDEKGERKIGLVRALFYGTFIGEILLVLSVYGWVGKILARMPGNVGIAFQQVMAPAFNTFGAFKSGAAMFLAIILILFLQNSAREQKIIFLSRASFVFLTLWSLAILNFSPAWVLLILMLIGISACKMYVGVKRKETKMVDIIAPIVIIAISVIFLFDIISRSSVFPAIPNEARLSAKESILISLKSLRENFVFGSGQGNFAYNFSKFKSRSFNDLDVWQLRFNKADNYITELIATAGILGLLSWLGLAGFAILLILSFKFQISRQCQLTNDKLQNTTDSIFFGLLAVVLGQFFYSSTTLLLFMIWFLIILAVAPLMQSAQEVRVSKIFKDVPETLLAADAILAVIAILFAAFLIGVAGKYKANVVFAKIADNNSEYTIEEKEISVINANKLDKKNSLYPISLTRIYLSRIKDEIKKPPSEQSANLMRDLAEAVVNSAVKATELSPNSVSAWELRGSVYRDIYSIADEAENAILTSFKKAIELEPLNPILLTELGKAYILTGDNTAAREVLDKALELKSEYEEAKIQLAIVKDKTGMPKEAIGELEAIASRKPNDARIFFETGRIYFNNDNIEKAIENFQKAVQIFPEYSNALYSLALCYTKNGQTREAINAFEKVLELNPNSGDVKNKISELKGENIKVENE